MKKVQSCALQKDFNYISSALEAKANIDDINESLQSKANKTSVANALQRKANRVDIDQLLESKADVSDLDQICSILEAKVEVSSFDDLLRQVRDMQPKVDRVDFQKLSDQVSAKSNREEVD